MKPIYSNLVVIVGQFFLVYLININC